jgi:hypothetical protein
VIGLPFFPFGPCAVLDRGQGIDQFGRGEPVHPAVGENRANIVKQLYPHGLVIAAGRRRDAEEMKRAGRDDKAHAVEEAAPARWQFSTVSVAMEECEYADQRGRVKLAKYGRASIIDLHRNSRSKARRYFHKTV